MRRPSDSEAIIANDNDFVSSPALNKIKWIAEEQDDVYVPSYTDVLRVSFTHKFRRGKIADLVSLLSGRNFETRENLESIAQESFQQLREGVEAFVSETNFQRYLMIVRSTGIIDSSLVRSQNVLNFGYILYLSLKDMKLTGRDLIADGMQPGPQIGEILNQLLMEVLEFPERNNQEYLLERSRELRAEMLQK